MIDRIFYTDGACSGNPGAGGYGVICLDENDILYSASYHNENTTNNRMELEAIIHVLDILEINNNPYNSVIIYSDSSYCVNMLNNWIWNWSNNDWKNSKGQEIKNIDLVKKIFELLKKHPEVEMVHVDGHSGIVGNELADALATGNIQKYKTLIKKHCLEEIYDFCSETF